MEYQLLDSGEGFKLERFGAKTLIRPSSQAIWAKRASQSVWQSAHATYGLDESWVLHKGEVPEWSCHVDDLTLTLRLQSNGQLGLFPEHAAILGDLRDSIQLGTPQDGKPKVLNLFAYTGMATVAAAKAGAEVCHVDLTKKTLDWTRQNLTINNLESAPVRLINDDALKFVEREIKRGNSYDVIVADPPSFSRISSNKSWKIDDMLASFTKDLVSLLATEKSALFLSCHVTGMYPATLRNLLGDSIGERFGIAALGHIKGQPLSLFENGSGRELPSGALATYLPALPPL